MSKESNTDKDEEEEGKIGFTSRLVVYDNIV